MSFVSDSIKSVANNRSLKRKQQKGIHPAGLPFLKKGGQVLEPASPLVVKAFQAQLAAERKRDQLIIGFVLASSLLLSSYFMLWLLGIL